MTKKAERIDSDDLLARLKRAEGQVRAIQEMLVNGRDGSDVIHQLAAARGALDKAFFVAIGGQLRRDLKGSGAPAAKVERYVKLIKSFGR